jgi:hypothetical protein
VPTRASVSDTEWYLDWTKEFIISNVGLSERCSLDVMSRAQRAYDFVLYRGLPLLTTEVGVLLRAHVLIRAMYCSYPTD